MKQQHAEFDFSKAVSLDGADYIRNNWEADGSVSFWGEPMEFEGKKWLVTYAFDEDETVDDEGNDLLAEDFPWDEDHIYKVEEILD